MSYRDLSSSALENLVALVKSKMEDLAVAVEFGELLEADKRELQAKLDVRDAELAAANRRISALTDTVIKQDVCNSAMRIELDTIQGYGLELQEREARIAELETMLAAIWELVAPTPAVPEGCQSVEASVEETSVEETPMRAYAPEPPAAPLALCDLGTDQLHIFPADHIPDGAVVLRNLHEPIEGFPIWDGVLGELVREHDGALETFEEWKSYAQWESEL